MKKGDNVRVVKDCKVRGFDYIAGQTAKVLYVYPDRNEVTVYFDGYEEQKTALKREIDRVGLFSYHVPWINSFPKELLKCVKSI